MSRPTHKLVIKDRNSKDRTYAGVGWENELGWISIKLNPGIVLQRSDDLYLNLYPNKEKTPEQEQEQDDPYDADDDDIPF